jgi:hypothetical protein
MKVDNSSISTTRKLLMYMVTEMKKQERSLSGEDTMVQTRDGQLSILIRLLRNKLLDTPKNGATISADHSISDQDFQ